jgi:hypothetical protein
LMEVPTEPSTQDMPLSLETNVATEAPAGDQMISNLAQSLSGFEGLGTEPSSPTPAAEPDPTVLPVNLPAQTPVAV